MDRVEETPFEESFENGRLVSSVWSRGGNIEERYVGYRGWENARSDVDAMIHAILSVLGGRGNPSGSAWGVLVANVREARDGRHRVERDYCVINANYRTIVVRFPQEWIAYAALCTLGLFHASCGRGRAAGRGGRGAGRRRLTIKTEREQRYCGWAYTRERDIMALLQSAYIIRARAFSLRLVPRGIIVESSLSLSRFLSLCVLPSLTRDLFPSRSRWCRRIQNYILCPHGVSHGSWLETHDGPKVSLNTCRRLKNRLRRAFIRRRNCSEPSGFRCRLLTMERNAAIP